MKEIIFIFLISQIFCVYYIKKKHGSVKVTTQEGIVYLNADNFGKNDKIHIQFSAFVSHVDEKIYYEFSDDIPMDDYQPTISKKPNDSWETGNIKDDYGNTIDNSKTCYKTSYEIKKDISAKYLIIKYTGYYNYYSNGFLKIENTVTNWHKVYTILFIIFLITVIILINYKYIKKCCKKNNNYYVQQQNNNYQAF